MERRLNELSESVETYHRLIEKYSEVCGRLRAQRVSAVDGVMIDIDSMIATKARLIASLERAIESTEAPIQAEQDAPR